MPDNTITLVGNIVADPTLKFVGEHANCEVRIAVNRYRGPDKEAETSFFTVIAWRELAEGMAETLSKGMRAIVVGRLEQRSWDTPEGEKRSVVEVQADECGPSLRWASATVTRNERQT